MKKIKISQNLAAKDTGLLPIQFTPQLSILLFNSCTNYPELAKTPHVSGLSLSEHSPHFRH